ncbi:Peroxisomal targeting signal 1 receptor [Trichoplax sp. H2]|nr:Peroxisomal targeting signal 1 receptor [Trichoplax sp. H2]|eukprot:RDD42405.1 Peroxisomal targeting signal 1 receptor [Trichoplax sp. H2]
MAMRDLAEGECGGANPLMKMTSHFMQDKSMRQEGLIRPGVVHPAELERQFLHASEHELVNEYLRQDPRLHRPPETFRMEGLLKEMKEIEHSHQMRAPITAPGVSDIVATEWANDFVANTPFMHEQELEEQYRAIQNSATGDHPPTQWADEYLQDTEHAIWAAEYVEANSKNELKDTAAALSEISNDPKFADSKFFDFVKKLSTGELTIKDDQVVDGAAEQWEKEFTAEQQGAEVMNEEQWVNQFDEESKDNEVWDNLQKEWESYDRDNHPEHPWLSEYEDTYNKEYDFKEDNPFENHPDPFNEGLQMLKEGNLSMALLLFEADVKKNPEHVEAWQYLGTTHAENEQENQAVSALRRCLQLEPGRLPALQALSVSYTNESLQLQACRTLKSWLYNNPKYHHLVRDSTQLSDDGMVTSSLMTREQFREIESIFLEAARLSPENVDVDVQSCLGVLYNLSGDYEKAADCFRVAVDSKPDDPELWNKLGATLANSNKSEEAILAYHTALSLSPGYVRARYNLGISCINLKAYREAIEHFLIALNMQRNDYGSTTMSDNIWSTLRMALSYNGKSDLFQAVDERDLATLNKEFDVSV